MKIKKSIDITLSIDKMDWSLCYDNYVEIYSNGKSLLKGIVLFQTVNPDLTFIQMLVMSGRNQPGLIMWSY